MELRGATTLYPRADPIEVAFPVVRRVVGERRAILAANGIRVGVGAEHAPALARAIVETGAVLLELRADERSLEEVFFELTTQKEIST